MCQTKAKINLIVTDFHKLQTLRTLIPEASKSVSITNPSPNVIQNDQLHLAIDKQECK